LSNLQTFTELFESRFRITQGNVYFTDVCDHVGDIPANSAKLGEVAGNVKFTIAKIF
jgi:hypothetical protein